MYDLHLYSHKYLHRLEVIPLHQYACMFFLLYASETATSAGELTAANFRTSHDKKQFVKIHSGPV